MSSKGAFANKFWKELYNDTKKGNNYSNDRTKTSS